MEDYQINVDIYSADLTKSVQVNQIKEQILQSRNKIDFLVNNAGLAIGALSLILQKKFGIRLLILILKEFF